MRSDETRKPGGKVPGTGILPGATGGHPVFVIFMHRPTLRGHWSLFAPPRP
jgi:hypothetical protein